MFLCLKAFLFSLASMFAGISVSVSILFAWKGGFWNKNSGQEIHFLQNDPNRCVRDAQCVFACLTVECYKFSGLTSPGNFICIFESTTWSGGTEVTGRWSLTNLQQHALLRRFLLHDHANPWLYSFFWQRLWKRDDLVPHLPQNWKQWKPWLDGPQIDFLHPSGRSGRMWQLVQ